jgi:hypothetical protein
VEQGFAYGLKEVLEDWWKIQELSSALCVLQVGAVLVGKESYMYCLNLQIYVK